MTFRCEKWMMERTLDDCLSRRDRGIEECRNCAQGEANYYRRHPTKGELAEMTETGNAPTRKCQGKCGEILPLDAEHFYPNRSCKDGFDPVCKKCRAARARDLYADKMRKKGRVAKRKKPKTTTELKLPEKKNAQSDLDEAKAFHIIDFGDRPELLDRLKEIAAENERTVDGQVCWWIRQYGQN